MGKYQMRPTFVDSLLKQAEADDNVWLLCADVGHGVLDRFRDTYPDRFVNCGIAEQNMIGVAAGLAMSGKKVYAFTMGNFVALRAMEQISVDVAFNNQDVTIVGVGAGDSYPWHSHQSVIDADAMCLLPNMTVYEPVDEKEVTFIMETKPAGPVYIKLP
jgi:transketolase